MSKPTYELTLHKTYHNKGFFNLGVAVERFVRPESGQALLALGESGAVIDVKVDRKANQNGTPRVFGGVALRNWIQRNFEQGDVIHVIIESPSEYRLMSRR